MRSPSLKLLQSLPDIHCPECELLMAREASQYTCSRCGYEFRVDAEKKLPVFTDMEVAEEEFERRYEIMKQFHSMRWSSRTG